MKENVLDIATDILKVRVGDASLIIKKMFKGANPYRQEPVPDEERIQNYLQTTPDEDAQLRQQFGDQEVDGMHARMQGLMYRRATDARL